MDEFGLTHAELQFIGEKEVGYELRSGYPTAFDRDYTLDLGAGAVQLLLDGESSVLVTRQAGRIVPLPFADIIDPETQRSRTRAVDLDSVAWQTSYGHTTSQPTPLLRVKREPVVTWVLAKLNRSEW